MNGGPNEYVRHGVDGLKIYPHADSVAWGLGTLFQDWKLAREMGENGRQSVADAFTWDVIAQQTIDVYRSLPGLSEPKVKVDPGLKQIRRKPAVTRKPTPWHGRLARVGVAAGKMRRRASGKS